MKQLPEYEKTMCTGLTKIHLLYRLHVTLIFCVDVLRKGNFTSGKVHSDLKLCVYDLLYKKLLYTTVFNSYMLVLLCDLYVEFTYVPHFIFMLFC